MSDVTPPTNESNSGPGPVVNPPAHQPLPPGAGAPLVPGPPISVSAPIGAGKINTCFGVSAVVVAIVAIVVAVLVIVFLFSLFHH